MSDCRPTSRYRPGRLLATLALGVVCAVPCAAVSATPALASASASGSIGLRLLDAPVDTKDDPRARVYIVDHLAPGAEIDRRIEVSNTTGTSAQVALYPAAATIDDGSFVGSAGRTPNELSTWTTVTPPENDVPAGARFVANVHIEVPADAAPGEQYGVVWAEARSTSGSGGVTQVSRVGIRLYLSVGRGGAPPSDFTIDTLTAQRALDGTPSVLARVHNTGGRALDMNGTLQLSGGPGGLRAGPFPATLGATLAIRTTGPVIVALDKQLPAGPWKARITLRSGLVERTTQASITFPNVGAAPAVRPSQPRPGWVYPAIAAGAVLLLLAAAGLLVVLRRHRRRPGQAVTAAHPGNTYSSAEQT